MKTGPLSIRTAFFYTTFLAFGFAACNGSEPNQLGKKTVPTIADAAPLAVADATDVQQDGSSKDSPGQRNDVALSDSSDAQHDAGLADKTNYPNVDAGSPINHPDAAPLAVADATDVPQGGSSKDSPGQRNDVATSDSSDAQHDAGLADGSYSVKDVLPKAEVPSDGTSPNHDATNPKCPIYVDGNAIDAGVETGALTSPWRTIQAAIDNPTTCDTIIVKRGTYHESISCGYSSIETIKSEEGASVTIIDRSNSTDEPNGIQMNNCSFTTIEGFTIANAAGVGILVSNVTETTIIQHNILLYNNTDISVVYGPNGDGYNGSPSIIIRNNIIIGNPNATTGPYVGTGIQLSQYGLRQIENNLIIDNWSSGYVQNNIVMDEYNGILQYYSYNTTIAQYNCLFGNTNDYMGAEVAGTGDVHVDPMFVGSVDGGVGATTDFHLSPNSPCRNAGNPDPSFNNPDGTRNDIGPYGGPFGVW